MRRSRPGGTPSGPHGKELAGETVSFIISEACAEVAIAERARLRRMTLGGAFGHKIDLVSIEGSKDASLAYACIEFLSVGRTRQGDHGGPNLVWTRVERCAKGNATFEAECTFRRRIGAAWLRNSRIARSALIADND